MSWCIINQQAIYLCSQFPAINFFSPVLRLRVRKEIQMQRIFKKMTLNLHYTIRTVVWTLSSDTERKFESLSNLWVIEIVGGKYAAINSRNIYCLSPPNCGSFTVVRKSPTTTCNILSVRNWAFMNQVLSQFSYFTTFSPLKQTPF